MSALKRENMKNWILTAAAFATLSSIALAGQTPHSHKHTMEKKAALICPVTGDKIASTKAAVGHSVYKGKTYYFCCPGCKPRFDKDPATFVKNAKAGKFEKM